MVDHEPTRIGFEEKIYSAEKDLAVVLDKFNRILDEHVVRIEPGAEMPPETSCTLDCVSRRHCPLTGPDSDKGSRALDRVVAIRIDEPPRQSLHEERRRSSPCHHCELRCAVLGPRCGLP